MPDRPIPELLRELTDDLPSLPAGEPPDDNRDVVAVDRSKRILLALAEAWPWLCVQTMDAYCPCESLTDEHDGAKHTDPTCDLAKLEAAIRGDDV